MCVRMYCFSFSMHPCQLLASYHKFLPQVVEEVRDLCTIVILTIITGFFTYGKSAISMHFFGKLRKEALVGGSLAISMANITGFLSFLTLHQAWKEFHLKLVIEGYPKSIRTKKHFMS